VSRLPAPAVHRDSIAHALRTWREAEALLAAPLLEEDLPGYERAIAAVMPRLTRCATVAELVTCYLVHRRAVDRWAAEASRALGRPELLPTLVVDAACWRRCRSLIADAVA
jgi:hypothetical protein